MKELPFFYQYLDDDKKAKIVETQITELEGQHYWLTCIEPSKLEQQAWQNWYAQKSVIEKTILEIRAKTAEDE